ncbi:TPA: diacylglycerol kinase family protein [Candidatus Galligastranaerophilus faecipullorum]|nr:diacylglycerol kinase family protein [Candidatus Galligastranaerophilus faecipullorum]
MKKFQSRSFMRSALYALNGLRLAFKSERNFRKHLVIAFVILSAALFLRVNVTEFCLLIFANAQVLVCELFNSVFEYIVDAYYKGRWAKLAKLAKDIAAGAVLFSAIISVLIASLIFAQKFYTIYCNNFSF